MITDEQLKILDQTLDKIETNSVMMSYEALEVIQSAMIPAEYLDFFADKIIDLANRRECIAVIKIECYSLMSQIAYCGGLDTYKKVKGLA
jgi:hypothetical protein